MAADSSAKRSRLPLACHGGVPGAFGPAPRRAHASHCSRLVVVREHVIDPRLRERDRRHPRLVFDRRVGARLDHRQRVGEGAVKAVNLKNDPYRIITLLAEYDLFLLSIVRKTTRVEQKWPPHSYFQYLFLFL